MSDNIPEELLIDILTRLPVETLVRCTAVCKSWYSLISSSGFISTHLSRTISNNDCHLFIRHYSESLNDENYSLHCDNDTFDEYEELTVPFKSNYSDPSIIGSCNGLICLLEERFTLTITLWNPSIRKFLSLPWPGVTFKSHGPVFNHSIGFGFNPVSNDYKIVTIVYLQQDQKDKVPPEVEVYELSTGYWRSISAGDFSFVIEKYAPQAFLNGVAHWVGYNPNWVGSNFYNLIVSFDLGDEVFRAIMVPDSVANQRWWSPRMHVEVFGESLSLIHYNLGNDNSCCIWVMKEYGVVESWTKQFTIDVLALGGVGKVFGFRRNGDVILEIISSKLVSYDPKSKQIKSLGIHKGADLLDLNAYMKSLVLLKGVHGVLGQLENFGDAATGKGSPVLCKEEDDIQIPGNQEHQWKSK